LSVTDSAPCSYRRIASLKSAESFAEYVARLGITLCFDRELKCGAKAPLQRPYLLGDFRIGNRFCVLPMEGWDGTADGRPSDLTVRRWRHFGESGAKLIWGGEAVAVRHDGRANPNQLLLAEHTASSFELRSALISAHEQRFGSTKDLLIGLQLTHSGRFARPNSIDLQEPRILYHHPLLDPKVGIGLDYPCLSDSEIEQIIGDFVHAAVCAQRAGFAFVDIKHCHGYLGHEFLSALTRSGKYEGSFANRTSLQQRQGIEVQIARLQRLLVKEAQRPHAKRDGVPISVSFHSPSSMTPASSHFWINRSIRGSATRCWRNFSSQPRSRLSKNPRISASSTKLTFFRVMATYNASSA